MQNLPFLKKFLPVFAIAAFLPFLLFYVVNSPNLRFTSQANPDRELVLWFEPATVIAKPGEAATVTVIAEMMDTQISLFNLQTQVRTQDPLVITPATLKYQQPFSGRVTVGTVTLQSFRTGTFQASLPAELVTTSEAAIKVKSSDVTFIVRQ